MAMDTDQIKRRLNGSVSWKWLTGILATIAFTLVTAYFTYGRGIEAAITARPTTPEVRHLIDVESPYIKDRKDLQHRLEQNTAAITVMSEKVGELEASQRVMYVEQRHTNENIERLMRAQGVAPAPK